MVIIIVIINAFVVFVAIIFIIITSIIIIITIVMICIFIKRFVLHTRANEPVAIAIRTDVNEFKKQHLFLIRIYICSVCTLLCSKLPQQE